MKIFVTRTIPDRGIEMLKAAGHEVAMSLHDRVLTKEELLENLESTKYDALLCLLTDTIDADVLEAAGDKCRVVANYAVGYDNIDVAAARERNILVTNTPGVLTETVAEHTFALILSIAHRIAEADRFTRAGHYDGWAPMLLLGTDVSHKVLGIVGLGRIGARVVRSAVRGFDMRVLYYDVKRDMGFERDYGAEFRENVDDMFREADFVSLHVPLLDSTRHLVDARRLALMKRGACLINTSRGAIVDEAALVEALRQKTIRGAALDVFEHEPALADGLAELDNVILTPHIASATEETRQKMSALAAENILAVFDGKEPPNVVQAPKT
ncbi:MAG: D-glycerate dehydrogenase [bacterium]|nr:D-glycerate dehydrogenase [bacterium]MDZ4285015.1 D-glycerate dehydrogenase [Patescibacteria group bacterium]